MICWKSYYFMWSCCSVAQLCLTLCHPVDCSTPGFPVRHHLPELLRLRSIESVMPSNHLILCYPLLSLPSVFACFRVFFNESVLRIRRPKYWSFSFSISPSREYSGLISFRIDGLISLLSKELSRVFSCGVREPISLLKKSVCCDIFFCCFSITKLFLTLCYPMDCSTPGFPVLQQLLEFAQTHVH